MILFFLAYVDVSINTPAKFKHFTNLDLMEFISEINLKDLEIENLFSTRDNDKPLALFKQALRKIRFEMESMPAKTYLVSSTKQGVGKTFFLVNLAYSLILIKRKVLIIDTNLKNNTLSHMPVKEGTGIMARGNAWFNQQLIQSFDIDNIFTAKGTILETKDKLGQVDLISCKASNYSPDEFFKGDTFKMLLDQFGKTYDYIFLEGAAMNDFADSKELMTYVEKVLIIFGSEQVIQQADKDSIEFLDSIDNKFFRCYFKQGFNEKCDLGEIQWAVGSWKWAVGQLEVGSWKLEVGSGQLEVGSGQLEVGSWKLAVGSGQLEVGSWKWEVGSWKLVVGRLAVGSGQLGVGSWKWAVGSGQLEVGSWKWAVGSWKWAVGSWQLEVGSWQLEVGSWQWAVGSWKLAVGSWKLAVGSWKLEVGSWKLEVGSWKWAVGSGQLEVGQKEGIRKTVNGNRQRAPVKGYPATGKKTNYKLDNKVSHNWLKSGLLTFLEKASVVVFGFGSVYLLLRILSKAEFGIWALFLTITTIVEVTKSGFIQNALVKYLVAAEEDEYRKIMSASVWINGVLTLLGCVLFCCFGFYIKRLLGRTGIKKYVVDLCLDKHCDGAVQSI